MTALSQLIPKLADIVGNAAIACYPTIGLKDPNQSDQLAVTSMRQGLNQLSISGTIVIGEGERDQAPMLFINETVGTGGPAVDIAVDPLEGTALCANNKTGAITILALSAKGGLFSSPDCYMEKFATNNQVPASLINLDAPLADNLKKLAKALDKPVNQLKICLLNRTRHQPYITTLENLNITPTLIEDGDILACLDVAAGNYDAYIGIGGSPEGVLAAAALKVVGGQFYGRLLCSPGDDISYFHKFGITNLDHIYDINQLAKTPAIVAIAGVTNNNIVPKVTTSNGRLEASSMVLDGFNNQKLYFKHQQQPVILS